MRSVCYSLFALAIAAFAAREAEAVTEESPAVQCSPVVNEVIGNSGYPFVDNSVEIVSQGETSVTFNVNQLWLEDGTPMLAVSYRDSEQSEDICALEATPEGDIVPYDETKTYTAECHHGFAEIAVYLFVGTSSSFIFEECESCSAPNDDYCGYYITVPCIAYPECETSTPTSSPTQPIDPSPPIVTDCTEASKAVLTTTIGDVDAFPDFDPPITVTSQDVDDVTIVVEQVFDENGVAMLSVGYPNAESDVDQCDMATGEVQFGYETTVTAKCNGGYAEVSIYLYTGDDIFNVEECEKCTITDETSYVGYHYVIPCIPVCKPDVPDCLEGPLVTLADIGDENDICVYNDMPVMVQDNNMNTNSVGFFIDNTWSSTGLPGDEITAVSVSYTSAKTGEVTCDSFDGGNKFITSDDLSAVCVDGMATIVVSAYSTGISYVADQIEPNSCSPPEDFGACSYEVVLPCDPMLVCGTTTSPTKSPTAPPTDDPTTSPTKSPTPGPTSGPTKSPTKSPTPGPTPGPTKSPTKSPTPGPTNSPTSGPTPSPTPGPTKSPTSGPTPSPTSGPTKSPTPSPTSGPTPGPTSSPTGTPTTSAPTGAPTFGPTNFPTQEPSGSAQPTGCHEPDPPKVVDQICMTTGGDLMGTGGDLMGPPLDLPEDAITITSQSDGELTFEVSQEWIDGLAGLAIRPGMEECIVESAVGKGVTFGEYVGECIHGFASVTIIAYLDDDFTPEKCVACDVEDLEQMGGGEEFCAYQLEIPCESKPVECGEPSASPSGSFFPSAIPTASPSKSMSPTPAPTGTPTKGPTPSPTAGPTPSPTSGPTPSPTVSPTSSPTPSPTSSPTKSPTGGPTPGPTPGPTAGPTPSPTKSPTDGPTSGPTPGPTPGPSSTPTKSPTDGPTPGPTSGPTPSPTKSPTAGPTPGPTPSPTDSPTPGPTSGPTKSPTPGPTSGPTKSPTPGPTPGPTAGPTDSPTFGPTGFPTKPPSEMPSENPSGSFYPSAPPSDSPTKSPAPTASPTGAPTTSPTKSPTPGPTSGPTDSPTPGPTKSPTPGPTPGPTSGPTKSPTPGPTSGPTKSPTPGPTSGPTKSPTPGPTVSPTPEPTAGPTEAPTFGPTGFPTKAPSEVPTGSPTFGPTGFPTKAPSEVPTGSPTASMAPTSCTEPMPPKVVDSICMTTGGEEMELQPLPPDAITINNLMDGQVSITVSQEWTDIAGIAIEAGMDSCIINENVTMGGTEDLMATCVEGYAGVTVVVYLDETFDPDKCDACNVDELSEMEGNSEFCAYRIEIPCDTMEVECGEPSAAPSGSFYPSSDPTPAPSKSAYPSSNPTGSPTTPPTPSPTTSPTPSPTTSPTPSPTSSPTTSPTPSPTSSPTASPTPSPTEKAPTDPPSGAPTQCPPSDAILIANEGETMYPDLPVTITYQNTTHVEFYVENTFTSTVSSVYTQYHSGSFGETECLSSDNVDDVVPTEFVAHCMKHTKISIVNVWITDCTTTNTILGGPDNAEIPECCYPGEECKTVQYTFKLPCESPCPVDGVEQEQVGEEAPPARRLVSSLIQEKKALEGSTSEFESLVGHSEPNDSNDHFCVVEDYPCGAFHDKVHVCHYSARDGYKTFCVPESDSDALRFYPKDYCGPCVGGYHANA